MSESKFTPLPWSLKTFDDGAFIITEGSDVDELKNCVIASRNAHNNPEESIANSELLRDAPKLIEALRELVDFSDRSQHHRHSERSQKAFDAAHELLNRHGG